MKSNHWNTDDIPDLSGTVAVVTGGNTGLRFRSCLELSRKNAEVILASRSVKRGQEAVDRIQQEIPGAKVRPLALDLIDADSIQAFAEVIDRDYGQLDLLLNNAGVVSLETYRLTPEGHEMHMATNHLGHFALTGRLFNALRQKAGARVVTVSSGGYRGGVIDFEDFNWQKRTYHPMKCYGDSKFANLLFMVELQRRFEALGIDARSIGAHPGLTKTERHEGFTGMRAFLDGIFASPMEMGVLPQLRAATDPQAQGGAYYGPKYGLRGGPEAGSMAKKVDDRALAEALWSHSEALTGVEFPRA